jgi:hypothetical protein
MKSFEIQESIRRLYNEKLVDHLEDLLCIASLKAAVRAEETPGPAPATADGPSDATMHYQNRPASEFDNIASPTYLLLRCCRCRGARGSVISPQAAPRGGASARCAAPSPRRHAGP